IDLAKKWGVKAVAGSEEDVLSRFIIAAEQYQADLVIRVTGDNILTDPENIDRMVTHHIAAGADYTRTNGLPMGITAEVMSLRMLQRLHNLMPDPNQSEYMMIYAFDPDRFHCEVLDAAPDVNRPHYSLTVDTPADLELIRYLYGRLSDTDYGPLIKDVVALFDADPANHTSSDTIPIRMPGGKTLSFGQFLEILSERTEKARRKYSNMKY
ncbi:MAG: hypothetical protein K8R53_02065, partial [Bacteroidales bacterium]|nr:hypothetical protein [Bacteroidales bacterium]